jgi:hypothetical protein
MANTGYKGYANLEWYYVGDGAATGITKPNAAGQADYIAPVYDTVTCPVFYINLDYYGANIDFLSQYIYFNITSNYPSYTYSSDSGWLTVSGGSGGSGQVTLRATKNTGVDRYAQVSIIYGGSPIALFAVTQYAT